MITINPWYTCIPRKVDGLGCNINISVNDLFRFLVGQTEPFPTLGSKFSLKIIVNSLQRFFLHLQIIQIGLNKVIWFLTTPIDF